MAYKGMDFIWWIPPEFWEVQLSSSSEISPLMLRQFMSILEQVTILGVVQADVSPFGAFSFLDQDVIRNGLTLEYQSADGEVVEILPVKSVSADLEILLAQLTPALGVTMGNLGDNFYFFVFGDVAEDGTRLVSPYESGQLRITLAARMPDDPAEFPIDLPIDAFFVPRTCPNGKPAHVSWRYCPWDGHELEQ